MYAAQFSDAFADAVSYGWHVPEPRFDLARLTAAKNAETARLEGITEDAHGIRRARHRRAPPCRMPTRC